MEGTCQCTSITFTTPTPAPSALYICHCTECRHQSSSSYGLTAIFPYFPLSGPIATYGRPNPNGITKGFFCTNCGSRIYHLHIDREGRPAGVVSVKAGCLKELTKEMMRKAVHIWTKSAVVDIPEGVEAYEEEPPGGSFSKKK